MQESLSPRVSQSPHEIAASQPQSIDYAKKYWWAAAIAVPLAVASMNFLATKSKGGTPAINITSQDSHDLNFQQINVIEREYRAKTGQMLPTELRAQLQQALDLIAGKEYAQGASLLGAAAEQASIPSVLANLGNALALSGKATDAEAAFAKAAAEDPSNMSVTQGRSFLGSLKGNSSILSAAEIPTGTWVTSTLLDKDSDYFRFTTAGGPRDHYRVRIQNKSTTLAVAVDALDNDKSPIGSTAAAPAADLAYTFPTSAGAVHYVHVRPNYTGGGTYSIMIEPTRSFDAFEPNDTILVSKEIAAGQTIEANIMDNNDSDFYRFRARSTKTSVIAENRSDTLGIAIQVTDADKASVGSKGGEIRADVRYEFESKPGAVYQVQVSPHYSNTGKYALTIQ